MAKEEDVTRADVLKARGILAFFYFVCLLCLPIGITLGSKTLLAVGWVAVLLGGLVVSTAIIFFTLGWLLPTAFTALPPRAKNRPKNNPKKTAKPMVF